MSNIEDLDYQLTTVLQYNKRDLPNAIPSAHLDYAFAQLGAPLPAFEASAITGNNVLNTIDAVSQGVLQRLHDSRLARQSPAPTTASGDQHENSRAAPAA